MAPTHTRRRPEKQAVQSRVFLITDLLGQIRGRVVRYRKIYFPPWQGLCLFPAWGQPPNGIAICACPRLRPLPAGLGKAPPALFELAVAYPRHAGAYGQVYRVDTLWRPSGKQSTRRAAAWQKARLEKALDTILADGSLAAWQYQELNVTVVAVYGGARTPELIRATYQRLARHEAPAHVLSQRHQHSGNSSNTGGSPWAYPQIQAAEQLQISRRISACSNAGPRPT